MFGAVSLGVTGATGHPAYFFIGAKIPQRCVCGAFILNDIFTHLFLKATTDSRTGSLTTVYMFGGTSIVSWKERWTSYKKRQVNIGKTVQQQQQINTETKAKQNKKFILFPPRQIFVTWIYINLYLHLLLNCHQTSSFFLSVFSMYFL